MRSEVVVVLVTCPTSPVARRLANHLITRRLAACVNIVGGVESIFRWKGKTQRCREILLVIKTTRARFASLQRTILSLHPYDVPEVIALTVVAGHRSYLQWVRSSVSIS